MRRFLPIVLTLAWGLWFGGLVATFLAVTSLFETFATQRALAGTAAAGVFRRFEAYQLGLGAVAVAATALWWVADRRRSRPTLALLLLLLLAMGAALVSNFAVTSRIEDLRRNSLTDSPQFRRLHGISMAIYSTEAAVLLAAGLLLPIVIRHCSRRLSLRERDRVRGRTFEN